MADKAISQLNAATIVGSTDLFVLEQSGEAKKLTGQILENWLVSFADGHGGIQSIAKTSSTGSNPVVDTYTITLSDTTTATFTVTNGIKGDQGVQTFVWIKYADNGSPTDAQIGDSPDDYIGIYVGTSSTAPTTASSYAWYKWKGETGTTGDPATVTSTAVAYQQSDSGSVVPDGSWTTTVPSAVQGKYLWTRTTITFNTGDPIVAYSVGRYGLDGAGSVVSVNSISPDQYGNVALTADNIQADDNYSVQTHLDEAEDILDRVVVREKSILKNKKYLVIGDSWCSSWDGTADRTPWATRMATSTGAVVENHAYPGSGFVAKGNLNKDFSDAIQEYPNGDYDAIIIQGGVNDINAAPTTSTIATAVARFATASRTMYPNVDIYYIATAPCKTLSVAELIVLNALIQEARINNIIVCTDVFNIGSDDSSIYKGDANHPSDAGYSELARCVAQFLTGGSATPRKPYLYKQSHTEIFSRTTISATGTQTLSADVRGFDALVVTVYNGTGASDCKSFYIPKDEFNSKNDVSWNATDSTSWYAIVTVGFSGTTMSIYKCDISGFSAIQMKVYGVGNVK